MLVLQGSLMVLFQGPVFSFPGVTLIHMAQDGSPPHVHSLPTHTSLLLSACLPKLSLMARSTEEMQTLQRGAA